MAKDNQLLLVRNILFFAYCGISNKLPLFMNLSRIFYRRKSAADVKQPIFIMSAVVFI